MQSRVTATGADIEDQGCVCVWEGLPKARWGKRQGLREDKGTNSFELRGFVKNEEGEKERKGKELHYRVSARLIVGK